MGSPAIRVSKAVTRATVIRLRRSAASKAFATSKGHIAGASASVPAESRSRTPSVKCDRSSSKHQATATDASRTIRLIMAAGINQLPDCDLSQIRTLSKFANLSHNLIRRFSLASIGWNQLRNRNPTPRDPDRLALGNSFQQAVEMGFGVKDSHGSLVSHVN